MSASRGAGLITPALIASLQPLLLRQAVRMVGRREVAEDVVQDTWISALRSVDTFEGRSTLTTWLIAIMRRRVYDLRRQNPHRMRLLEETDWIRDSRLPEVLDARIRIEAVYKYAGGSSGPQRAIMLCAVEDHERDDAAALMNVSRGHLRVLLHRGRAQLRDVLTR